jgi:hypothetical protein
MSRERAGIFDAEDDLDVTGFRPKAAPLAGAPPAQVRAVSEALHFQSREPQPALPVVPAPAPRREPRRYRTGRNVQLNIKARAEAIEAFYTLADQQGWVLGEAFERAVEALKHELSQDS